MKKLSVVINTKNAARTVEATLQSVAFADEVVLADMASSDQTVTIAKKYGARIITIADYGRVEPEARNEANQYASGSWILQLDADEVVTESLQKYILEFLNDPGDYSGVSFPRKNYICGQWIEHTGWWPDYQLRLFKHSSILWTKGVHSKPEIRWEIKKAPLSEEYALIHENYKNIFDYIERLNRYTSLEAEETSADHHANTFITPFSQEFFRRYFHFHGWQDGQMGLLLSLLQSFYELTALAKRKEQNNQLIQSQQELPENELRIWSRDLNYWLADYHVQKSDAWLSRIYWQIRRKLKL